MRSESWPPTMAVHSRALLGTLLFCFCATAWAAGTKPHPPHNLKNEYTAVGAVCVSGANKALEKPAKGQPYQGFQQFWSHWGHNLVQDRSHNLISVSELRNCDWKTEDSKPFLKIYENGEVPHICEWSRLLV
eukprot:SAG11_NODE_3317_length_2525_cov_10.305029_1_plen_132_part_00